MAASAYPAPTPSRTVCPRGRRRLAHSLVALTAAALLLAACGKDEPEQAPAPDAAAPAVSEGPVVDATATSAELLERANAAVAENRLFEPPEDNAVALFLAVIERAGSETAGTESRPRRLTDSTGVADPAGAARLALDDLFPYGLSTAQGALAAGRFDEAERVIALLTRVQPEAASLRALSADLAERRDAALRAEQAAEAARNQPVAPRPVAETPAPPVSTPSSAPPVSAPPQSPPAASTPTRPPVDPAPVASKPAAPAEAPKSAASSLVPITRVSPRYPPRALRQRLVGLVVVSFLVRTDGSVDEVKVTSSEPKGVFEREAISAMQRWRFEPVPAPVRSELEFSFTPTD